MSYNLYITFTYRMHKHMHAVNRPCSHMIGHGSLGIYINMYACCMQRIII